MRNQNKILSGLISALVGISILILGINALSKPDNYPVSFHPIDSLGAFFFTFVFTMGNLGWLVAGLILTAYLALFYFIGTWLYNLISGKK